MSPIDPIRALYWSAVVNGVVAVPVMAVRMVMTGERRVMGRFVVAGWLRWLGAAAVCETCCFSQRDATDRVPHNQILRG